MTGWPQVLVAVVWVAASVPVALRGGRALHRAGRRDLVGPLDCPPWCVRERAAALHDRPRLRRRR